MTTEAMPILGFPALSYTVAPTKATVRAGSTQNLYSAANVVALGRPAKRLGLAHLTPNAAPYRVGYTRTHGAINTLYLAWWYVAQLYGETLTVDLTIKDDTGHTVASSSALIPSAFKSGTVVTTFGVADAPARNMVLGGEGYLDLDALAATLTGPNWSLEFTLARPSGTLHTVAAIEGYECPRGLVDDQDTYGVVGPPAPGRQIVSGPASGAGDVGWERLAKTIEGGIATNRAYVSLGGWPTDITAAIPRTTSAAYAVLASGAPADLDDGADPVPLVVRVRPVTAALAGGGTATGEAARVRFLFYVAGGGTADFQVTADSGVTTTTAALTGLTGASWQWSDWLTLALPTDGTGAAVSLKIRGRTSAGTLYLADAQAEENVS